MSTKKPTPIFRMPKGTRAQVAIGFKGRLVELVWSPSRSLDNEHTFRGTMVSLAEVPGQTGYVAIIAPEGKVDGRFVHRALPLSQIRSIAEVKP